MHVFASADKPVVSLCGLGVCLAFVYSSNVSIGVQCTNSDPEAHRQVRGAMHGSVELARADERDDGDAVRRIASTVGAVSRNLRFEPSRAYLPSAYSYWAHWRGDCPAFFADELRSLSRDELAVEGEPGLWWLLAMRLRVFLIVVLVVALWAAWRVKQARAVRRLVELIYRADGAVEFDSLFDKSGNWKSWIHPPKWVYSRLGDEYFSNVRAVTLVGEEGRRNHSELIRRLRQFPNLKRLELQEICVGDADLELISKLAELEEVAISEPFDTIGDVRCGFDATISGRGELSTLTPAGLRRLAELKNLRSIRLLVRDTIDVDALNAWSTLPKLRALGLLGGGLEDAELRALARFTQLEELSIMGKYDAPHGELQPLDWRSRGPLPIGSWNSLRSLGIFSMSLSSEEMHAIGRLSKLESFGLYHSGVSDAELVPLREMTGLKSLVLSDDSCSFEAIEALKRSLPRLRIRRH